jgi:hypothetical protein
MNNNFGFQERNTADLELLYDVDRNQEVKYSRIKDQFKTGDIILVDGRYSYSGLLDFIQGNRWGHAAMVVRGKDIDGEGLLGLPELMLWESNVSIEGSTPNVWGNNTVIKEGPMLIDLEARLRHSRTNFDDVVIARKALNTNRSQFNFTRLGEYFSSVINKKFPSSNTDIVLSVLWSRYTPCFNGRASGDVHIELNRDTGEFVTNASVPKRKAFPNSVEKSAALRPFDPERMYCTELVAATYKQLGLLGKCPTNYAYAPRDFSDDGRLSFVPEASLEREVFIDILN